MSSERDRRASQAEGRGFESLLPLQLRHPMAKKRRVTGLKSPISSPCGGRRPERSSALDLKPTPLRPKPRSRGSSASNSATRSATGSRREILSLAPTANCQAWPALACPAGSRARGESTTAEVGAHVLSSLPVNGDVVAHGLDQFVGDGPQRLAPAGGRGVRAPESAWPSTSAGPGWLPTASRRPAARTARRWSCGTPAQGAPAAAPRSPAASSSVHTSRPPKGRPRVQPQLAVGICMSCQTPLQAPSRQPSDV